MKESSRLHWIDSLKVFSIFLVILGHTKFGFHNAIFSFHMPLFMIISGFLYKRTVFRIEIKKVFYCLFIPYIIYSFFYMLPLPHGGEFKPIHILNILIGNQEKLPPVMIPLWYIISVSMMRIAMSLRDLQTPLLIFISLIVSIIIIKFLALQNLGNDPFQILTTIFSFPFFLIGKYIRENKLTNLICEYNIFIVLPCLITVLIFSFVLGQANYGHSVNLFACHYGQNIIIFYLSSALISVCILFLFKLLLNRRIVFIENLSNGTLLILCLHLPLIWTLGKLFGDTNVSYFILSVIIVLLSYPLIILSNGFLPVLIGKMKKTNLQDNT